MGGGENELERGHVAPECQVAEICAMAYVRYCEADDSEDGDGFDDGAQEREEGYAEIGGESGPGNILEGSGGVAGVGRRLRMKNASEAVDPGLTLTAR